MPDSILKPLRLLMISTIMVLGALIMAAPAHAAQMLMTTHGQVSFAPYVQGIDKSGGLYPGYRADFLAQIDILRWRNAILNISAGNQTVISRTDTSLVVLDRIRYRLTPGIRIEYRQLLINSSYYHESVYTLSRAEELGGAFWRNSLRLGLGSKGAYFSSIVDQYSNPQVEFNGHFDAQINGGIFIRNSTSIWGARNHSYQYELFSLFRWHAPSFKKWLFFFTLRQHLWLKTDHSDEQRYNITLNLFRRGRVNLFGVYYTYTFYDTNSEDNEDRLGAVGIRLIL